MSTNQTHHDIRYALTAQVASMVQEKAALAAGVARNTAIGDPSTGDGGVAATGQLAVAIDSLQELLDDAAGDPDFGGLAPVIQSLPKLGTVGSPINIGPSGESFTFRVANLLPFPLVELDPVGAGSNINISQFCSITWAKGPFPGQATPVSIGTVTIRNVATSVPAGQYTLRVSNPLDTGAAVAVSAQAYFTNS